MDAARLNFSHGTHDEHLARLAAVRRVQELIGRPLAVIADLQGPKIRLGANVESRPVNPGELLVLAAPGSAGPGDLDVTFAELAEAVRPGGVVLVDDGRLRLRVEAVRGGRVECRVEVGGVLSPSKGVNLPGTHIAIPSLTPKDLADLELVLEHDVDFVALSFVRTADDVLDLRERIERARSGARVIAKIEKGEAVENLGAIIEATDAVMVARGDLGVEIGVADVPLVQKQIIRAARDAGRTVITATQMLDSMIRSPEPTRAEASDVANAVLDGTSAIMLSGETAAGAYPVEAVQMMNRIARVVEPALSAAFAPPERRAGGASTTLSLAACDIAESLGAAVLAVPTHSGLTARQVSRWRPPRPIVAASPDRRILQQLALEWAVVPVVIDPPSTLDELWQRTVAAVRDTGLARAGDRIVLTGGTLLNERGTTDHIVVRTVE
jgi:pyruvate kinase